MVSGFILDRETSPPPHIHSPSKLADELSMTGDRSVFEVTRRMNEANLRRLENQPELPGDNLHPPLKALPKSPELILGSAGAFCCKL